MDEDFKGRPSCAYQKAVAGKRCVSEDAAAAMSLWTKAQTLTGDALQQVRAVYGEHFPIEVRHFLAGWIEEKMWQDIDPDNPAHEPYVNELVRSMIQELDNKANNMNTEELFLTRLKLTEAANMFRNRYSQNPGSLIRIIRHCLNTEIKLVQQVENAWGDGSSTAANQSSLPQASAARVMEQQQPLLHPVGNPQDVVQAEINQQLEYLRLRTQKTGEECRRIEQEQEAFALQYHECTKLNAHLQHLGTLPRTPENLEMEEKLKQQKNVLSNLLNQKVANVIQFRIQLADQLKETVGILHTLQARVLDDELIRWKREQQLAGNGSCFNSNLDSIQEWCEALAEIIWMNRQQIKEADRLKQKLAFEPPGVIDILPSLNSQITQLLSSLVTSTFIIEKQPPQVMKTNTRFTSTVRLLVGGKLNVHMTPPQVKVSIISESQANSLLKNDKTAKGDASGEILNNTGTMEYHQATRQLSVSFRNMQLKKIKRAEKKGTESVMDEKFSLLFQSQFSVGGGELVFQVWTLSLPVVVIVHGNQEPHAWATVTWDNAFAEGGRAPFVIPDKVAWHLVAEALNMKFKAATGRSLTEENLRFLGEKAFRSGNSQLQDYSSLLLSWSQFCKEPLPERNFTFWEWFYAVMKLTREHLRGPWVDGAILGFVRKKQAEEMLATCSIGTFLLRFSDSELGGVTIAWVEHGEVFMLQPFTSKDFAIRSLADRISDLSHLVFLYPDIPKDQPFGKYYNPFRDSQPAGRNGYVMPVLVTHVPGWGGGPSGVGSYPPTPQNIYQPQSPDGAGRDTASVVSGVSENAGSYMNPEYDYTEFMGQDLPTMDENVSLDLNGFNFDLVPQTYKQE
ncbi:signal transducer and activator of transcription 5B isoform X2 [Neocloeon triangulifer]|uniref:signal transducer and activator of transcription 5B isoform X2 n=1 Tax=Neocloeon triangulifer TaxID=2078957 RepID=UPI00286F4BDF|nr:signal transducer and activator of transcription 5B isoform X2 [Neocloeon triangulifer]